MRKRYIILWIAAAICSGCENYVSSVVADATYEEMLVASANGDSAESIAQVMAAGLEGNGLTSTQAYGLIAAGRTADIRLSVANEVSPKIIDQSNIQSLSKAFQSEPAVQDIILERSASSNMTFSNVLYRQLKNEIKSTSFVPYKSKEALEAEAIRNARIAELTVNQTANFACTKEDADMSNYACLSAKYIQNNNISNYYRDYAFSKNQDSLAVFSFSETSEIVAAGCDVNKINSLIDRLYANGLKANTAARRMLFNGCCESQTVLAERLVPVISDAENADLLYRAAVCDEAREAVLQSYQLKYGRPLEISSSDVISNAQEPTAKQYRNAKIAILQAGDDPEAVERALEINIHGQISGALAANLMATTGFLNVQIKIVNYLTPRLVNADDKAVLELASWYYDVDKVIDNAYLARVQPEYLKEKERLAAEKLAEKRAEEVHQAGLESERMRQEAYQAEADAAFEAARASRAQRQAARAQKRAADRQNVQYDQ